MAAKKGKRKRFSLATNLRKKIINFVESCTQILIILAVIALAVGPAAVKVLALMLLLYVGWNVTLNLKPRRAR